MQKRKSTSGLHVTESCYVCLNVHSTWCYKGCDKNGKTYEDGDFLWIICDTDDDVALDHDYKNDCIDYCKLYEDDCSVPPAECTKCSNETCATENCPKAYHLEDNQCKRNTFMF